MYYFIEGFSNCILFFGRKICGSVLLSARFVSTRNAWLLFLEVCSLARLTKVKLCHPKSENWKFNPYTQYNAFSFSFHVRPVIVVYIFHFPVWNVEKFTPNDGHFVCVINTFYRSNDVFKCMPPWNLCATLRKLSTKRKRKFSHCEQHRLSRYRSQEVCLLTSISPNGMKCTAVLFQAISSVEIYVHKQSDVHAIM